MSPTRAASTLEIISLALSEMETVQSWRVQPGFLTVYLTCGREFSIPIHDWFLPCKITGEPYIRVTIEIIDLISARAKIQSALEEQQK